MVDSGEIEGLMHSARRRVLHLWSILAAAMVMISLQILWHPQPSTLVAEIVMWSIACAALLTVLGWWVRRRIDTTHRFLALVRSGELDVEQVIVTTIKLEILPFGHEVDVHLRSGESLALGFWSLNAAERLQQLVARKAEVAGPREPVK
jgi:hypothetical protein